MGHTPTPDEYARMSWYARLRLNRAARPEPERKPIVVLHPKPPRPTPTEDLIDAEWAERECAEARRMLAALPADPDAAEHRQVAYEAAYGTEVSKRVGQTFRLAVAS